MAPPRPSRSERAIVFLIGAVQFVNILDFVMVMPLGPDFARSLGIPTSHLGWIGGAYVAAAAVAGFSGSFFLDRFDRKRALVFAMGGLAVGTALGGFAWNFPTLLMSRVVAGLFGGPATSIAFSIIADTIPNDRRGRAMGAVMGAFAFASIAGVPAALELARLGSWQWPFFGTAVLGVAITFAAAKLLPSLRGHITGTFVPPTLRELGQFMARRDVRTSYTMTALQMAGGFILIPNISGYLQFNLGFPRSGIGALYTIGGAVSFISTRLGGKLTDRKGSLFAASFGVLCLSITIFAGFLVSPPLVPVSVMFVSFMFAMGFRNVAATTLASKVPTPRERARFMSLQSTVQHLASAAGSISSAHILSESSDGKLEGMPLVAALAIGLNLAMPMAMAMLERLLSRRSTPLGQPDPRPASSHPR